MRRFACRGPLCALLVVVVGCGEVKSGDPDGAVADASASGDPDAAPGDVPDAGDDDVEIPDAEPDARPPCTWGAPNLVANVNSATYEIGASVSADSLQMVVSRLVSLESDSDILLAKRSTTSTSFGTPVRLALANTLNVFDDDPELSNDGLELFFRRSVPETTQQHQLWSARRGAVADDFGGPTSIGVNGHSPRLSGDGLSLYYVDIFAGVVRKIVRPSIGGAWGTPRDVMATSYGGIDISDDELEILLSDGPAQFTGAPLAIATRRTRDEAFSAPVAIPNVVAPGDTGTSKSAAWRSGGREMYFLMTMPTGTPTPPGRVGNTDVYTSICE